MATASPISFRAGERIGWAATLKVDGTPVDLTGWTFEAHLRKVPSGELLTVGDVTVSDPESGTVTFTLERNATIDIPATPPDITWGTDGWAFEPDGTPHALPRREVTVEAAFTHA